MSDQTPPPPPPAPSGPPQQPQYGAPAPATGGGTNGLAVASLILGILWLCWLGSLLAVIFGHVALGQIKKSGETQGGKGLAIAGLVLGYLGIATLVLSLVTGGWEFSIG